MNKGINTLITDFKKDLTDRVNQGLREGLPISVIHLVIDNIFVEINGLLEDTLKTEEEQYSQSQQGKVEETQAVEPEIVQ